MRLAFANIGSRKAIWPLIIEKAFAKLNGNYDRIIGGYISESIRAITKFPIEV